MAKEQRNGGEQEAQLSEAVEAVERLYMGDQLQKMLGGFQSAEQRDQLWEGVAQQYTAYSGNIAALREALQAAEATKPSYPASIPAVMSAHFARVGDKLARPFLGDVLLARTLTAPGYIDYGVDAASEATAMAGELGAKGGFASDAMKGVTLTKAIGSVLKGELKLTRQTPPAPRGRRA